MKFLFFSVVIHLLGLVIVVIFANTRQEKVYENIDFFSNTTPQPKSNAQTSKSIKLKPERSSVKSALNETFQTADANTNDSSLGSGDNEQIASDADITTPAMLLTKTKANRTEAARKADYSGVSQVELIIGSDGSVKNVKLRNSLPYGLNEVALRLVQESKFRPAMIKNKPVASAILFKVRFESE